MNYTILYSLQQPVTVENSVRLECATAVDAFALFRALEEDRKVVMLLDGNGKQVTRDDIVKAAHSERDD